MAVVDTQFSGQVIAGRYRLGQRRGSGVEAATFEAYDQQLQRIVAVRMVHPDLSADPEFRNRFNETMAKVVEIHHPNLAVVHDYGSALWSGHEVLFTAVEHLAGGSLRDLLDRGRSLSPSQALMVGLDTCKALDTLHRRGLTHGDIRPATLVFGDDRRLRIIDVGLAGALAETLWVDPATMPNDRATYASPELAAAGVREPRGDVYALCLTLLEVATRTVPFLGDSAVSTLSNRVGRLMPVSADLGPLAAVLERAGRPDPADRSTAAEFGRALVQTAQKLPRPEPIPIIGGSLLPAATGQPPDPSGPLRRPPAGVASASVAAGAEPNRPAPSPAIPAPTETSPSKPTPTPAAAPVPAAAPTLVTEAHEPAEAPRRTSMLGDPAITRPEAGDPVARVVRPTRTRGRWPIVAAVAAVVALIVGGIAWFGTRVDSHVVPAVEGLPIGEALNKVAGKGWATISTEEASETVAAGNVIRTQPPAGTDLREGAQLQFVVSTGPAPRPLPELVGLSVADATTALTSIGLVIEAADPVFDETVPVDQVISWSVPEQPTLAAGATVVSGTTVRVIVSAGPAPRTIPDLVNADPAAARSALEVQNLVVAQLPDEFSDVVAAGLVIRTDPPAGAVVARGTTVSFVVSKGPDVVPIPALANMTIDQVQAALAAAGLTVGVVTGDPTGIVIDAQFQGTSLLANQLLPRGAAIDITLLDLRGFPPA
jgi:eukaryotic-like serine/threonine-protein kinase